MQVVAWLVAPERSPSTLVAIGGFIGAAIRASLDSIAHELPATWLPSGVMWSTWVVNLVGACLLGALGAWVTIVAARPANVSSQGDTRDASGPARDIASGLTTGQSGAIDTSLAAGTPGTGGDTSRHLDAQAWGRLKLLVGTGGMGALTTYGTWAVGSANALHHDPLGALLTMVGMLTAGICCAGLGYGLVQVVAGAQDGAARESSVHGADQPGSPSADNTSTDPHPQDGA